MAKLAYVAAPIGLLVSYKGTTQVIVNFTDDMQLFKICDPLTNKKLQVKASNVTLLNQPELKCVEHNMSKYLVSAKGTIISLTTGRTMKWSENDGNRVAILAAL